MESIIGMLYYKEQNMIYNALPRTLQPGYNFGPHCHKNVEVCMMTEGECDIVVNGETITVRTGEMMVIFPHMIHSFHMRSRRPAVFLQMHFQPDSFSWVEPDVAEEVKFLGYMTDEHSAYLLQPFSVRLRSCVERICTEMNNKEEQFSGPLAKIYIYEMVFLLSREISQGYRRIFVIENPLAIRAIQFISDHMEEKIGLADVAEACQVTPRYLSTVFKEVINITVNDYINIGKVDKAMRWLTASELTITEIASRLGFSSTQYFSTVFKRYTHVTPGEYKLMTDKNV